MKSETALCEARPFKALKFQEATIVIENEPGEGERWKASPFEPLIPPFSFRR